MKYNILVLISTFYVSVGFSQSYQPIYFYQSNDFVSNIIEVEDNKLIIAHTTREFPSSSILLPSDVRGSFSRIDKFNNFGQIEKSLTLPDDDSLHHYIFKMIELPENKILIAGEASNKNQNNRNDFFFALTDFELDSFSVFFRYNTLGANEIFKNAAVIDGLIYIYYSRSTSFPDYIRIYDLEGNFVNAFNLNLNGGRYNFMPFNNSFFIANYRFENNQTKFFLSKLKIFDSTFSFTEVYNEADDGDLFPFNSTIRTTDRGKTINDSVYIFQININYKYTGILQIDTSGKVNIFYFDSAIYNNINLGFSNLDFTTPNHIYLASSESDIVSKLIVYSVNEAGSLNWKKNIDFDNQFERIDATLSVTALKDKGCIVSFLTRNINDNKENVYAVKLDSSGTVQHFFEVPNTISELKISRESVLVYPNPANDVVNIELLSNENFTFEMYNLAGQKVKAATQLHHQTASISISDFSKGMYFYQIKSESGNLLNAGKFLKE